MSELYTRDDVIIWPDDPRLEEAIGREAFLADSPIQVLLDANNTKQTEVLLSINKDLALPFEGRGGFYSCIILKKGPKKEWIPFDLYDDKVLESLLGRTVVYPVGTAPRYKIWGYSEDSTGKRYLNIDKEIVTDWEFLMKYFFSDGSRCGVEVEA